MRVVATLLSVWVGWRWVGFLLGAARLPSFPKGPVRREARRTVVARGAINVFLTVAVVYLWASIERVQPSDVFVGFLAAAMMCSLAIGVASAFMQPQERTVETLDACSVFRRRARPPSRYSSSASSESSDQPLPEPE